MITIKECKKIIFSIQGNDEEIKKLYEDIVNMSVRRGISLQKIENYECTILLELTKHQKSILSSAKRFGYYDYPRRITSEELSEKIGENKDLTLQSLRKAEKTIISRILNKI